MPTRSGVWIGGRAALGSVFRHRRERYPKFGISWPLSCYTTSPDCVSAWPGETVEALGILSEFVACLTLNYGWRHADVRADRGLAVS